MTDLTPVARAIREATKALNEFAAEAHAARERGLRAASGGKPPSPEAGTTFEGWEVGG